MKITIIGSGYVGLVTGAGLADIGHSVVCVDLDSSKVSMINSGQAPFYEEGLNELLARNIFANRLRATTDLCAAITGSDLSIIAVGTPFDGREIDTSYVRQAAIDVGRALKFASPYHVVCVKSTVVPGTTEGTVGPLVEKESGRKLGVDLGLCMNPEFLAEGTAVRDFMNPDRVVIGATDERTSVMMQSVYSAFLNVDVVLTTPGTAEMAKYTANSFLATVISFSNEIANLCAAVGGIDVIDVMQAVHLDRRLSPLLPEGRITPGLMSFLLPGTGFGGSCFPKDVKALVSFGARIGNKLRVLEAVVETNVRQPEITVGMVREELGSLFGKRVAVLGLAFKPGTDDVRESPAISIISALLREGAIVAAHDPVAIESMKAMLPDVSVDYCIDINQVTKGAEAVVLVTSWPEYQNISDHFDSKTIPLIDGRRFLEKANVAHYRGIGLGRAASALPLR